MHYPDRLSPGALSLLSGLLLLLIVVTAFVLTSYGTEHDIRPLSQKRTISLSTTPELAPILEVVGARFAEAHAGSRVKISTLSVSAGLSELSRGRVHAVVASYHSDHPAPGVIAVSLVRDGVTVAIHQGNSIQELGDTDIADIFVGRLRNWKFVGGEDAPIDFAKASAGRIETEALFDYLKLDNIPRRLESIQGDSERVLHEIAKNPRAIGITSVATGLRFIQRGVPVKLIRIKGVEPTLQNVASGDFPVILPVNMMFKAHGNNFVQEFVEFTMSDDIRALFAARQFAGASS